MIHLCPLSPQDRLNLACTVTSRAQLFDRLKGSSNPEIYSLFLRQEIEDLYGPISPKMERQLRKIRDITSLTESLLHAKCNQKGRLLKKYHIYQPNLKQDLYRLTRHRVPLPDISLPRLVSFTASHLKTATAEQRECARQLVISLLKQQLEDSLVAVDVSDFLNQHVTFVNPHRLQWTHTIIEVPSLACTSPPVSFCSNGVDIDHPNGNVCARVKRYHLTYPNVFAISPEAIEILNTMIRGDLALTRIQHVLLSRHGNSSLTHWHQIVHLGSRKYFDKLAHVDCLRGILGLLPEAPADRVTIDLLHRDLLDSLLPSARKIYCDSHTEHLHSRFDIFVATDPEGMLVALVSAEDDDGTISTSKLMTMIQSRVRMLYQKGFDFRDLVG